MKEFLPFIAGGFITGFSLGVLVDIWALLSLFP